MNYYLTIIQNDETCAIFKYDSYDTALAQMYTELAYRGSERMQTFCQIIDCKGHIRKTDLWEREEAVNE